jgi:hypothetical protein
LVKYRLSSLIDGVWKFRQYLSLISWIDIY